MKLTILAIAAMQYFNQPYMWGGNGPYEFDCSGLVIRCLHDSGITLPDMTAQDLHTWAVDGNKGISCTPQDDCLLFFGDDVFSITHVAISISPTHMIEAGGAGRNSLKMSKEELAFKNARVRLKLIKSRKNLVSSIKIYF